MFSIRNLGTLPTAVSQMVAQNPGKIALVAGVAIGIIALAKAAKGLYQIKKAEQNDGKIQKKIGDKIVWVWPRPERSPRAKAPLVPLKTIEEGPKEWLDKPRRGPLKPKITPIATGPGDALCPMDWFVSPGEVPLNQRFILSTRPR
jgi:hypothetical protein